MITIFRARRVLTINPSRPEATHVALRDGQILGAGPLAELTGWGAQSIDAVIDRSREAAAGDAAQPLSGRGE